MNLVSQELGKKGSWQGMFPLLHGTGRSIEVDWRFSVHSVPGLWLAIASDATERIKVEFEREQLLAESGQRAARSETRNEQIDLKTIFWPPYRMSCGPH